MSTTTKVSDTLQKYYDKIFQDGKLMNVHIGMWGMSFNLSKEDIMIDGDLPETIKLGKKMLIKPAVYNKFKTMEQKIRKYLYVNSFDFPLVSQAHFVPKTKFIDVYTQLNKLRDEFMQMADEFVENYEAYKREALDYYEQHKEQVRVEDLEAAYPSAAAVKAKFYVDIVAYEIALPTTFQQVSLQDELSREELSQEVKNELFQAHQAEYQQQLQTHMSKVENFMDEAVKTLRGNVVEFCTAALSKINKREVVSDANIKALLNKVRSFRQMNFLDDKVIEEKLNAVESFVTQGHDFENDKVAVTALQQHLNAAVREAKSISDTANLSGEYFRKLNV